MTIFRLVTHQPAILPVSNKDSAWAISNYIYITCRDVELMRYFIDVSRVEFNGSGLKPHYVARWMPIQLIFQTVSPFSDIIVSSVTELLEPPGRKDLKDKE